MKAETTIEVDEMEAGLELDALVAERVIGMSARGVGYTLRPYSSDIAAAWEVVEAIIGRAKPLNTWGDSHRLFDVAYLSDGWTARIHENHWDWPYGPKDEPELDVSVDRQETAPLAICRVALKAMEEKHDT